MEAVRKARSKASNYNFQNLFFDEKLRCALLLRFSQTESPVRNYLIIFLQELTCFNARNCQFCPLLQKPRKFAFSLFVNNRQEAFKS
jgi:hypothetical protein